MIKRAISLMMSAVLLNACAVSPKQSEWDEKSSKALNIANAAGIDGLKDQKLPEGVVDPNLGKNALDVGYIFSGYMNPPPGFTSLSSAGIGIAGLLFSPDARPARNSFFFWDKKAESKDEFYKNFVNTMESAKKKYEENGGKYKITSTFRAEEKSVVLATLKPYWSMSLSGPGCTTKTTEWGCVVGFNLAGVRESFPPNGNKPVLHADVSDSHEYTFYKICLKNESKNKYECEYYDRSEINNGFNELEFLAEFTKYLPEDFYIYVAPNRMFIDKKKPIKMPIILSQGQPQYFLSK